MKFSLRSIVKILLGIALLPLVLFVILSAVLYIPAVQDYAVREATRSLSNALAMNVSIDRVRLSFPLDLDIKGVLVCEEGDTLLAVEALRVDVPLKPLLSGRADLNEFTLVNAQVDTKQYIPDTHLWGVIGSLTAVSHGVDLSKETARVDLTHLADTRLCVALSDTAAPDTTTSAPINWCINTPNVLVERTALAVSLPGDSMRVFANLAHTQLTEGSFDLGKGNYELTNLNVAGAGVAMGAPTAQGLSEHFTHFLSATALQKDTLFAYLADSLHLTVDSLTYEGTGSLLCGVRGVGLREQSGLRISDISGKVYMDSVLLSLPAWNFTTPYSHLTASVNLPWSALEPQGTTILSTDLQGHIGCEDLQAVMNMVDAGDAAGMLPPAPLRLELNAVGNMRDMQLTACNAQLDGILSVNSSGQLQHLLPDSTQAHVEPMNIGLKYHVKALNMKPLLTRLGIADTTLTVPVGTAIRGNARMKGDHYQATARMTSLDGTINIDASTHLEAEQYAVTFMANRFPLPAFLPSLDASAFSGILMADGKKFNPTVPKAVTDVKAQIDSLTFAGIDLSQITLAANIAQQHLDACFTTNNTAIQGEGSIKGNFIDGYHLKLEALLERCSLQQLAGAKHDLGVGSMVDISFDSNETFEDMVTSGSLCYNHFDTPKRSVMMKDIFFDFATNLDTTTTHLNAGNMTLAFGSAGHIANLSQQIVPMTDYLGRCAERLRISHDTLRTLLPGLNLTLHAGNDNPMTNILRAMGYTMDTMAVNLATYPEVGVTGDFMMKNFHYGDLQLDNVSATISHNDRGINLLGEIINSARRNPNKFDLNFRTYLLGRSAGVHINFKDEQGDTGFDVGLIATLTQEGVRASVYPKSPIIAFRTFDVNRGNYIFLGNNKQLEANMRLQADDGTGLQLLSENTDSLNDISLNIQSLNLSELSNVIPYMPKMGGLLHADVHMTDNYEMIAAMSSITTTNFEFEGTPLGNIGADVVYLPKSRNEHYASAFVSVDGTDVMECNGTYNSAEEGYFEGDAILNGFPLALINGFLQGTDVYLKGDVLGGLHIAGDLAAPRVNGEVNFADSHVYSPAYGFDFKMDDRPIIFNNSQMQFNDFKLHSSGNNPLTINGTVDMSDMDNMSLNFAMSAKEFELINTKRKLNSIVYGKAYVDFDCTMRGELDNIVVRGDLDVLHRTNVSYVLKDSPLTVDNQLEGLVQFVSFEDTTSVAPQAIPSTNIDLTLNLGISDAAHFYCALSEDGKSYLDVQGGGDLTLRMTQQGEMRLMGRLTMEDGEMKYTLPIIPLKTFKLTQGSYIEFTGDIMNPTLNIQAKERMKSVVTENDQQRSVAFDVGVAISKTLENMGLEFTVEAPEDMGIQNQLTAMTPAQRSKVAVSLMATGLFMGDGTGAKGGSMQAGSALSAFLQSEIQNIAGSALRTVDINFGIENSTTQTGATTTDYSFQFSKRFFNNRFAVNIGGKVSTGNEANNSAASFIDNITLEYRLDKGATRYIQVFYDHSNYDPLEGELVKMGTGIVLRKKTNKLGELFIFK